MDHYREEMAYSNPDVSAAVAKYIIIHGII